MDSQNGVSCSIEALCKPHHYLGQRVGQRGCIFIGINCWFFSFVLRGKMPLPQGIPCPEIRRKALYDRSMS